MAAWRAFYWTLPIIGTFSITWMLIVLLPRMSDGALEDFYAAAGFVVLCFLLAIIDKDQTKYPITFEDAEMMLDDDAGYKRSESSVDGEDGSTRS